MSEYVPNGYYEDDEGNRIQVVDAIARKMASEAASAAEKSASEAVKAAKEAKETLESVVRTAESETEKSLNAIDNMKNASVQSVQAAAAQQEERIAAKGEATLETIPDDYTALSNDVAALTEEITSPIGVERVMYKAKGALSITESGLNGTGAAFASNKYQRTDFINVKTGQIIEYNLYSSAGNAVLAVYNTANESDLRAVFTNGRIGAQRTVFNVDVDCYVRFACHITYLSDAYIKIYQNNQDITLRNNDVNDIVFAAADYHRATSTSKRFTLLAAGDVHGDADRLANIVEYLNYSQAIDAGIMLGDIAGSNFTHDATYYTKELANSEKPFLTVIGNHDAGNGTDPETSYVDIADLHAKFIAPNIGYAKLGENEYVDGNTYYYKDVAAYNIRLIVLNQFDMPSDVQNGALVYDRGNTLYSQAQIDWLCQTLASTPEPYHVMIAIHSAVGSMALDTSNILTSDARDSHLYDHSCVVGEIIPDIVHAWMTCDRIDKAYDVRTYYNSSTDRGPVVSSRTATADFTGRAASHFIGYIGGHWHGTYVSHNGMYKDQLMYSVDCANMGAGATEDSDTPRALGTKSEDCFVTISIDTDAEKMYIVRVGAHMSKDLIDRNYGVIDY